jgi:hypothetical protein
MLVCIHVCMHACMYVCMYACRYSCTTYSHGLQKQQCAGQIPLCIYMYVCVHIRMYDLDEQQCAEADPSVYMYVCMYVCMCVCVCVCMYVCVYVCMYVCMCVYVCLPSYICKYVGMNMIIRYILHRLCLA